MENKKDEPVRCGWCGQDELYVNYHDNEWGRDDKNEQQLFEFLILEGAQAGLSWITILRRRDNYRKAFEGFVPVGVAAFGEDKIRELIIDPGIIRHEGKIRSAVANARLFLQVQEEFGTFRNYLLGFFPDRRPIVNNFASLDQIPASTPLSDAISKDMKKRGFKFFGTTICYAYLQAVGLVNDHIRCCSFRKV